MRSVVSLAGHLVGDGCPPFVVAELSANHDGSLERALQIVDAVADAGVDAIKLQTFRADELTIDADGPSFRVSSGHGLWGGERLIDLYRRAQTPWEWHRPIFDHARERGLVPFSSPFSPAAVDFLEDLGCEVYKVASAELVDLPLIGAMAATGKPLVMSTGMATFGEIERAVSAASDAGCTALVLMVCTSSYPAVPQDARLARIPVLRSAFAVPIGLSDHTQGIAVSVAAISLGAAVIEKHVTLSTSDTGLDAEFSLEPGELATLCHATRIAYEALGEPTFGPQESEADVLLLRRSLYVVEDVTAGDLVTETNVRSIRPSGGLLPDALPKALGRRFRSDVRRGTPFSWSLV